MAGCNYATARSSGTTSTSFNPQPALWPDATRCIGASPVVVYVSILNRLCGRMQRPALPARGHPPSIVSILNRLCGRMQRHAVNVGIVDVKVVSILNRLCGRMQPSVSVELRFPVPVFQSSTGSVAGCNRGRCCTRSSACTCFNPQPALWPDATWAGLHDQSLPQVSILNRLCGRMQRRAAQSCPRRPGCFNPQPALWPDATSRSTAGPPPQSCFNPQPALWPDATRHNRPSAGCPKFQSSTGSVAGCNLAYLRAFVGAREFQSSTGSVAGCNRMPPTLISGIPRFQSSTGSVAGCNCVTVMFTRFPPWCFNPQPALWPDATRRRRLGRQQHQPVSILNRLCGRMQPPTNSCTASSCGVSILNRLCGRMQRARTAVGHLVMSFNPQPALWPDATPVPGFPIGSSRTSSTMPSDDHFRHELSKSFTRATIRTRTSNVRGRQQRVRVTPPAGR